MNGPAGRGTETASAAKILARIRREADERRALEPPLVIVRCTEWVANCLPEEDTNAPMSEIKVAYRGRDLWAVLRRSFCLSTSGEWDYEHIPSEREDEWLAEHRFPLDRALELARTAAQEYYAARQADAIARSKEQP